MGAWALGRKSLYRSVGVSAKRRVNVIARSVEPDESDAAISGPIKAAKAGSRRGAEFAGKRKT